MSEAQESPQSHQVTGLGGSVDWDAITSEDEPSTEEASNADSMAPLPLDQIFDVLRNERRRRTLKILMEGDGTATTGELAEEIAAWETGKSVHELNSRERKRVYVGLYQCHLPKMDDMDVVEFNKPRGTIELGRNAAELNRYLEKAEDLGTVRQWPWYYALITLVGGVLYLASLGLGVLAVQVVLGLCLVSLGAVSVYHLYESSDPIEFRSVIPRG